MENDSYPPSENPFARVGDALSRNRALVLVLILVVALIGFEMFNYSTTEFALTDLLGDMRFAGIRWATILSLAFCGIDFAGIARLFTPEAPETNSKEVWFLFGAWLLAATLNATLTWWGVAMALTNRSLQSSSIVDPGLLSHVVPVFVACVVWVTRILLISNLSTSGARFLTRPEERPGNALARQAAARYQSQSRPSEARRPAPPPPTSVLASQRSRPAAQPSRQAPAPPSRVPDPTPRAASSSNGRYAPRPVQNRPQPPKPAPKPVEPKPEPEEQMPPEPEYIPEEGYAPHRPSYHSLSARANSNGHNSSQRS